MPGWARAQLGRQQSALRATDGPALGKDQLHGVTLLAEGFILSQVVTAVTPHQA